MSIQCVENLPNLNIVQIAQKKSARPHICPNLNVWVKSQLFPADPKKWLSTFDTLRRIIFFEPFM